MNDRLQYLDCIKGVMILFVVYYHFIWIGVKFKDSPTVDFFNLVCMQMFFFVSGFVSAISIDKLRRGSIKDWLTRKIVNILIPTILMFVFVGIYYKTDFSYYIYNEFKNGYWFTYVLFEIIVLHLIIYYVLSKVFCTSKLMDIMMLISASLFYLIHTRIYSVFNADFLHYLSLNLILKYYFFYVLGYLVNKKITIFRKFIDNKYVMSFIIFIFIIFMTNFGKAFFVSNILTKLLFSTAIVIFIFIIFSQTPFFAKTNTITKQLSLFGRHSIEIYFIHYYFLFNLPCSLEPLQQEICFRDVGNSFIPEFLIVFPITLFISYICIGLRKIVNFSPIVSKAFLGPIPKD